MSDPFKDVINCHICGSMNDVSWTHCCSCGNTPLRDALDALLDERNAPPPPASKDAAQGPSNLPPYGHIEPVAWALQWPGRFFPNPLIAYTNIEDALSHAVRNSPPGLEPVEVIPLYTGPQSVDQRCLTGERE